MAQEIEEFYGVYLLYCLNPRFKGRTYIGFTVDPNRRIQQHNRGMDHGGAKKTSGRGPWDMVLITHGFPNSISALRFEWAWQNPTVSRRLKKIIPEKKRNEPVFQYKLRVLCYMLRTGPWNRLPLTVRWLKEEYHQEFEPSIAPPVHMPIAYGPVVSVKLKNKDEETDKAEDDDTDDLPSILSQARKCAVCYQRLQSEDDTLKCLHPFCSMESHTLCLSRRFLASSDHILPIDGACPRCTNVILWGDLIRYKLGCYKRDLESAEG